MDNLGKETRLGHLAARAKRSARDRQPPSQELQKLLWPSVDAILPNIKSSL